MTYPLGAVHALAQINLLWRGHDSGLNAEPADSGGKYVYFSPGVAVPLGGDTQIYGLVQLPLYQNVNGVAADRRLGRDPGFDDAFLRREEMNMKLMDG